MDYIFTSQRLGFRNWTDQDIKPMTALNQDTEVMEFFPSTQNLDMTKGFIKRSQKHFEENGICFFAVDKLENQEFIGFIGLVHATMESFFTPCVEIGWRLNKKKWGKGYATEGANACLDFGFNQCGFKEIYSFTSTTNFRSEHVMKKIGMDKIGEFKHPKLEQDHKLCPHVLYRIKSDDFCL